MAEEPVKEVVEEKVVPADLEPEPSPEEVKEPEKVNSEDVTKLRNEVGYMSRKLKEIAEKLETKKPEPSEVIDEGSGDVITKFTNDPDKYIDERIIKRVAPAVSQVVSNSRYILKSQLKAKYNEDDFMKKNHPLKTKEDFEKMNKEVTKIADEKGFSKQFDMNTAVDNAWDLFVSGKVKAKMSEKDKPTKEVPKTVGKSVKEIKSPAPITSEIERLAQEWGVTVESAKEIKADRDKRKKK